MEGRCLNLDNKKRVYPVRGLLYLCGSYHCEEVSCELHPLGVAVSTHLSWDLSLWSLEV